MSDRLFFGNATIDLKSVDSTNAYAKRVVERGRDFVEGLVVTTNYQHSGKGQRESTWESEKNQNLTFSILLKPKITIDEQFLLSKSMALGVLDFLIHLGIKNVSIKWPNDIYIRNKKVGGILIENSLKGNRWSYSIVGIGLNVNQVVFPNHLPNPTSLKKELEVEKNLNEALNGVLFFMEKRYISMQSQRFYKIMEDYLCHLYLLEELETYEVNGEAVRAKIVGVTKRGQLQLKVGSNIKTYNPKQVQFPKGTS